MRKKENIPQRFALSLLGIFCFFGFWLGIAEARNRSSYMSRGEGEAVVTQERLVSRLRESAACGLPRSFSRRK